MSLTRESYALATRTELYVHWIDLIPSALSDSDVTQAQQEKAEVPVPADK